MDPSYPAPPHTAPGRPGRPSRPKWWAPATGRAQSASSDTRAMLPPTSQVEVMFHQKYAAQAPPAPLVPMDDVRTLLASEPAPEWSNRPMSCSRGTQTPRVLPQLRRNPNRMPGRRPPKRGGRPATRHRSKESKERIQREEEHPVETRDEPPRNENAVRPALPPWLGVYEDHTEGGVHVDMAAHVAERIAQLQIENSESFIWVIIESCRNCSQHDSSLRHDEAAYQGRCQKLAELITEKFPHGVQVGLLGEVPKAEDVDPDRESPSHEKHQGDSSPESKKPRHGAAPATAYRIGSFEVYMCCRAPLQPWGAAPLSRRGAGAELSALCLSSKLRSRAWPSMEAVVKRMALAMPQVPLKVQVKNALGFPIPQVCLTVLSADQEVDHCSTDENGQVQLAVPLYTPITVRAERLYPAVHVERKERVLEVMKPDTTLLFDAETCIQLWQLQTETELIVFCRDPRLDSEIGVQPIPDLVPFAGTVDYSTGETLRADADGFIRCMGDPLENADFMSCSGWRSSPVVADSDRSEQVYGTGRLVELGRLGTPIAEISLVTCCCASPLPNARVTVNDVHFGTTDATVPVSCGLRIGDHDLLVEHCFLGPGLNLPLKIEGSTTCGIPVEFPLDRLRFLCTAAPGTRMPGPQGSHGTSDLWLVGGDLAQWRCSRGAPAMDAEVWLWDGELRGQQTLKVQAGALSRHGFSQESGASGEEGSHCAFTEALAYPMASIGPWQVVMQVAPPKGHQECAVLRLAHLAHGDAPALWLARLVAQVEEDSEDPVVENPCLHVHSSCCSTGAAGVSVSLNGEAAGTLGEHGELKLPKATRGSCRVGIQGVPSCLLPGSTNEYLAHFDRSKRMDLDLACLVWVYAVFPEPEEDEEEEEDHVPLPALVFVCTNVQQIPDDAKPVVGRLCCSEAEEPEIMLEGQSVGPILLRRSRRCPALGGTCLVAQLQLDVVAPPGYVYEPRRPSPLEQRHEELGGCELQRLMSTPAALGDLKLVNAQGPRF